MVDTPAPHRLSIRLPRPLLIGLTTFLLVVVSIGLQIGLPIYRRYATVRRVEELGGTVLSEKGGPAWLRRWFGDRPMVIFDEPYSIYLGGPIIGDAEVAQLRTLNGVWQLHLTGTQITDVGLERLSKMPALIELSISAPAVTDAGIKHLAALPRLGILEVRDTQVTEEGLAKLKRVLPDLYVIK